MKEKLTKEQLLELLGRLMHPKGMSEKDGDDVLNAFCAGCPDPVQARWLVVECVDPMTDEELVERAMAMPIRYMADVSIVELPAGHPLRTLAR
jgi:hypothetical protein